MLLKMALLCEFIEAENRMAVARIGGGEMGRCWSKGTNFEF